MTIDKIGVGDKFILLKSYATEHEPYFKAGTIVEMIGINDYPMTFGFRDADNHTMWLLPGGLEHLEIIRVIE